MEDKKSTCRLIFIDLTIMTMYAFTIDDDQ
jgi:hypothetical protein